MFGNSSNTFRVKKKNLFLSKMCVNFITKIICFLNYMFIDVAVIVANGKRNENYKIRL